MELVEADRLRVVLVEALEDLLEGVARAVLLPDDAWQPEERAHVLIGAARLDHLGARELAVAIGIDDAKGLGDVMQLHLRQRPLRRRPRSFVDQGASLRVVLYRPSDQPATPVGLQPHPASVASQIAQRSGDRRRGRCDHS